MPLLLRVRVAGVAMALPAARVAEVLRPRPLTRVPRAPASLLGLAGLRGAVLPVVCLARLLGQGGAVASPAARLVVLAGAVPLALLVDAVTGFGPGPSPGATPGAPSLLDPDSLLRRDFADLAPGAVELPAPAPATPAALAPPPPPPPHRLLGFRLEGQEYALPLAAVEAVARPPARWVVLPQAVPALLGAMLFRGALLPLVSLRHLLGLPPRAATATARVLVTRLGGRPVGLLVDEVTALLALPKAAVEPLPPLLAQGGGEARVQAIGRLQGGRRLVAILSPAALFAPALAARLLAAAPADGAAADTGEASAASGAPPAGAAPPCLVFRVGGERYGLALPALEAVLRHPGPLPRLPGAAEEIEGVMPLRGAVLPVLDARRCFGLGAAPPGRGRRVLVLAAGGTRAGLAVDAVEAVRPLPGLPAPGAGGVFRHAGAAGAGGGMLLLVDAAALLAQARHGMAAAR